MWCEAGWYGEAGVYVYVVYVRLVGMGLVISNLLTHASTLTDELRGINKLFSKPGNLINHELVSFVLLFLLSSFVHFVLSVSIYTNYHLLVNGQALESHPAERRSSGSLTSINYKKKQRIDGKRSQLRIHKSKVVSPHGKWAALFFEGWHTNYTDRPFPELPLL